MKRVLLTGATTPIGRRLVRRLLEDPGVEQVLAVGIEPGRPDEAPGRYRYERVDLTRERHVRRLMFGSVRELEVDTIVDMATHRQPEQSRRAHLLNVEATRHLLRFAERVPSVRRYVYRSYSEVYARTNDLPALLDEFHPLRMGPKTPAWILDRVEADLAVCARMGMSEVSIAVLRCAECLAPEMGSQLYDYVQPRVCFRPMGYDPMVNVISEEDLVEALSRAARSEAEGGFTIPGLEAMPLSAIIARWGRRDVPVPGPLMRPLYTARRATVGGEFHYPTSRGLLHFGGVLDGTRARAVLGYEPRTPVHWPVSLAEVGRRARAESGRSLRRWIAGDD